MWGGFLTLTRLQRVYSNLKEQSVTPKILEALKLKENSTKF